MSTDHTERRQALEELVEHPGWLLFKESMQREWGSEAVLDRLSCALARMKEPGAQESEREFMKLMNARELMRHAISWPDRELEKIRPTGEKTAASFIRRA